MRACINKTREVIVKRYRDARPNKDNEEQTETAVSADEGVNEMVTKCQKRFFH